MVKNDYYGKYLTALRIVKIESFMVLFIALIGFVGSVIAIVKDVNFAWLTAVLFGFELLIAGNGLGKANYKSYIEIKLAENRK